MAPDLPPLPDGYVTTRAGLHALAEHVLSPLRYRAEGRIGLRGIDGGFGPPLPDRRRVVVVDDQLHDGDRTTRITTLGDAARFLEGPLGAPVEVYQPVTSPNPDRPLGVEPAAAQVVCGWFAFGAGVLAQVAAGAAPDDDPSEAQLWPEHFDLALSVGPDGGRANVGASPGDTDHDAPYLYVGPWEPHPGGLWNEPWGASLGYQAIRQGADPLEFIQVALRALRA
jgi:hypothetical protein